MREIIIKSKDLKKYMTEKNYFAFITDLAKRFGININQEPIWIVAQVMEDRDKLSLGD